MCDVKETLLICAVGSVLADLSLAVPTVNSLSLVFTMFTGRLLGEEFGGKSESECLFKQGVVMAT